MIELETRRETSGFRVPAAPECQGPIGTR